MLFLRTLYFAQAIMTTKRFLVTPARSSLGSALSLMLLVSANVFAFLAYQNTSMGTLQQVPISVAAKQSSGAQNVAVPRSLTAVMNRGEIAAVLEAEGLKVGAELGVQVGGFAAHTLNVWKSCTKYYLVDVWRNQENYKDLANVDNSEQEARYKQAQDTLKSWKSKTVFLRMYTTEAAAHIPDDSLDYLYVDARHDYCGVMEDLVAYWPKLKRGGILAGHDYLGGNDPSLVASGQDWGLCMDGTRNDGAVKGAVDEFASQHGLSIMVTYREPDWPSWMARKL